MLWFLSCHVSIIHNTRDLVKNLLETESSPLLWIRSEKLIAHETLTCWYPKLNFFNKKSYFYFSFLARDNQWIISGFAQKTSFLNRHSVQGHVLCQQTSWFLIKLQNVIINQILFNITVALSRLCSVTFQQPLALGATSYGSSNLKQLCPFLVTFEQNIRLGHISSTKKSTIS